MLLSIIVPCYNEELALPIYHEQTSRVLTELSKSQTHPVEAEFVFIDDGSSDGTLAAIKSLQAVDSRVRYVSFSRNFGKESAMYAGLEAARGDLVVIMDADLQDPPSLLPELISTVLDEGYDCAATRRITRQGEPPIRSFFARMFYRFINRMSKTQFVDGARDYRLMTRQMVDAVLQLREVNRFSKGLFSWVGFNIKWLCYENVERAVGETKWSFWKLFVYSLEAMVSFSTAPLAIASLTGIICCGLAFLMAVFYGVKTIVFGDPVAGFPTLICVILFIGGLQLLCLGIVGQYLAKTFMEVKQRPIYIIREEG